AQDARGGAGAVSDDGEPRGGHADPVARNAPPTLQNPSLEPLVRLRIEEMHVLAIEREVHGVAFAQPHSAVDPSAHRGSRGLQVDDRALAELLDQLDPRRDAVLAEADRARTHAE